MNTLITRDDAEDFYNASQINGSQHIISDAVTVTHEINTTSAMVYPECLQVKFMNRMFVLKQLSYKLPSAMTKGKRYYKVTAKKHSPSPTAINIIKAVSGTNIPVLGQLEVPFEIDAHTYPFGAIVIECLTYEAILGRDFLECYDAKKDLGQQLLHLEHGSAIMLDGFRNFLEVTTEGTKICSINAQAIFVIPPLSEILVPATLSAPFDTNTVGCVEPRHELTERYNIIGAAEIVTISEQNTIPIRLLNPTDQPITIYRCTRLGQFSPAEADIATFEWQP